MQYCKNVFPQGVSIHASREGSDTHPAPHGGDRNKFQSTPPVRGATPIATQQSTIGPFQSTPPVRGATELRHDICTKHLVSIHAPREGSDAGG